LIQTWRPDTVRGVTSAPQRSDEAAEWEVERWLLRQGMSLMARNTRRFGVLGRAVPVLVGWLVWQLTDSAVTGAFLLLPRYRGLDRDRALEILDTRDDVYAVVWIVATIALSAAATLGTLRLRTRHRALNGTATTVAVVLLLLVLPAAAQAAARGRSVVATVVLNVGVVAGIAILVATGVASLVLWAVERAVPRTTELFRLVTRGLPLLLLLVTFLFINTEAWQVASSLDRTRLWLVVSFFAVIILAFLAVRLPDEVGQMTVDLDESALSLACDGTPLEPGLRRLQEVGNDLARHPLSRRERLNAVLVLVFSQATQVALLAVVVWLFFVAFVSLAIGDDVIESWVGAAPTPGTLFGVRLPSWLPVSNELIQVSVVIAAFGALNFAVAAVTDDRYRGDFFHEVLEDLRRLLVVREVYLNVLDLDQRRPMD